MACTWPCGAPDARADRTVSATVLEERFKNGTKETNCFNFSSDMICSFAAATGFHQSELPLHIRPDRSGLQTG